MRGSNRFVNKLNKIPIYHLWNCMYTVHVLYDSLARFNLNPRIVSHFEKIKINKKTT